ncbi:hypothetical protein LEP1GSC043_0234 [Leptospira weilii str. Ecochallenge]|uniref:Uncharacterized protein n=1 Tax=Leptospira weilii str. Ecochallenge TaxID=1049986 RepID=N1U478_9LEPT|nr:hypothetical protein LEP1GSC043_0234 [Leptospira weilii str. Ecochallenge]
MLYRFLRVKRKVSKSQASSLCETFTLSISSPKRNFEKTVSFSGEAIKREFRVKLKF